MIEIKSNFSPGNPNPTERRLAYFSHDGRYRFLLQITWDCALPLCQFVGLNPSTADEMTDDNTVRRCKQFAKDWGYGGLLMTNIFAIRSTDPKAIYKERDPVGAENNHYLKYASSVAAITVLAWGNHGTHNQRGVKVFHLLDSIKPDSMQCLGLTKSLHPSHPLYLAADTKLIPFKEAQRAAISERKEGIENLKG